MIIFKAKYFLGLLIIATLIHACKSVKPSGSTEVKTKTYPTADGYYQEPLAYSYNAFNPLLDAGLIKKHYEQVHSEHLKKLNTDIFAHESMMGKSLEELLKDVSTLPKDINQSIRYNGGGHWNYTFFWKGITNNKNTQPSAELLKAIDSRWGSIAKFKKAFAKASQVKYGQCWVWVANTDEGLKILTTQNNDNPLMDIVEVRGKPIIVTKMESQHFILNKNDRGMENFWAAINWERVSELFAK